MNLSLKGLVELQTSDGFTKMQTLVKAKNPSVLRKILQKKRRDLVRLETDVVDILPFLKSDFHKNDANADFRFYPGTDGFKEVYLNEHFGEIDTQTYTWDCLMPMDVIGPEAMNRIVSIEHQEKQTMQFRPKEIVALTDWTRHVLAYQYGRDKNYLAVRQVRYVDNPAFNLTTEIKLIGTQIRIACAEESEVWGLVVNSAALSNSMKAIFEAQWVTGKDVTPELVESWGPSEMLEWQKKK
jgi:hypothetical protein